jgi:hypothetical protein
MLCRFSGSRVGMALAFSRPSQTDAWCGCLSVWSCSGWAFFSTCVLSESRLEGGGVNRANLKFINLSTTTSRISVRNKNESEREGEKQIAGK